MRWRHASSAGPPLPTNRARDKDLPRLGLANDAGPATGGPYVRGRERRRGGSAGMAGRAGLGRGLRGTGTRRRPARIRRDLGPPQGRQTSVRRQYGLRQYDPPGRAAPSSRRSQAGKHDPSLYPLERGGDRAAGEQRILRARRPYREFPVRRDAVRYRFHAFLARRRRIARRRPRLLSRATALRASTPALFSRVG